MKDKRLCQQPGRAMTIRLPFPSTPFTGRLSSAPLFGQLLAVLREYSPAPVGLAGAIDRKIPVPVKQLLAEAPLNRVFAQAIAEGEFDDFEGRRIRLEIDVGQPGLTLGFWCGRLRIVDGPGETTIRGSWSAFRTLAERRQDPDQLFFQRRLVIEGDTELGLGVKNLLGSLEWDFRSLVPALPTGFAR